MQLELNKKTLSDSSAVFDVHAVGQPFPATSEYQARKLVEIGNNVIEAFELCNNDRQISELSEKIEAAIKAVLD
jgi:hypothetical protein